MPDGKMKVVLSFDLGDWFITELLEEFPDVEFRVALTPEDQGREAVDAEVIWGLAAPADRNLLIGILIFDQCTRENPQFKGCVCSMAGPPLNTSTHCWECAA